jgi:hypothetical protein
MRPHAFAYKMCADFPAPVSRDGPIVLGWAARSVATGISRYGTRAASGAGVSSYSEDHRAVGKTRWRSALDFIDRLSIYHLWARVVGVDQDPSLW